MHFKRALALCAVLGISVLAGCGGHSGATPPLDSAASALPDTTSTSSPRTTETTATPTVGLVGKIDYVTSGKFLVDGGSQIGRLWIYTNSGTQWSYNGLALKAGVYAKIYGTGSVTTSVTATNVSLSSTGTEGKISVASTATMTDTATPSVGLVGQVTYVTSGKFLVQGGSGVGQLWINTNSGTQWSYNGLTLKVGVYAKVYGTGSLSTSITATSISLSTTGTEGPISVSSVATATEATPMPSVGLVGQITYLTTGKFMVYGGSRIGNLWIYTNSGTHWTYNGLSFKVGDYATIYGSGSLGTSVTATSVSLSTSGTEGPLSTTSSGTSSGTTSPTAAPAATATPAASSGVPRHVQTAEYLTSSTLSSTNPSVYAPYLTWAYTLTANMGKTQAAGIKTVFYIDPAMPAKGQYEYTELTGPYAYVRAKGCTGSYSTYNSGNGTVLDPTKSGAASFVSNVINNAIQKVKTANPGYSQPWNLIFVDHAGPLYGVSPTPCDFNAATWSSALDADFAPSGQPIILNALSTSASALSTYVQRLKGGNIEGGEYEHCFDDRQWSVEENAQLESIALVKSEGKKPGAGFWCYIDGSDGMLTGSTIVPKRIFYYASFLLTYDPNYSVYQDAFATPSDFKVFPETGFVPMNPASKPSSVTSLLTSSGAYVQRYSACYYRGSLIGQCEIAVNPGSSTVSVPNPAALAHSMVLSGGGILDGGTATFKGARVYSLAPGSGAIMVP